MKASQASLISGLHSSNPWKKSWKYNINLLVLPMNSILPWPLSGSMRCTFFASGLALSFLIFVMMINRIISKIVIISQLVVV